MAGSRVFAYILGTGVVGGVVGGVALGGYKLRQELKTRNKSLSSNVYETNYIQENQCPLSDNFERLFANPKREQSHGFVADFMRDIGSRIAH